MRYSIGFVVAAVCLPAVAQEQSMQREFQRALIQLDQRSAEFAAQLRGQDTKELQNLHASQLRDAGRPLNPDPEVARQLLPYERTRMGEDRELRLPPPIVRVPQPAYEPLPLPGGPRHGVEPVAPP